MVNEWLKSWFANGGDKESKDSLSGADSSDDDKGIKTSPFLKGNTSEEDLNSDDLERTGFAQSIAGLIKQDAEAEKKDGKKTVPDLSSTVIGLEGDWGSGKTFTTKLIEREFKNNRNYLWLTFEPWRFNDRDHLAENFLKWLSNALYEATWRGQFFIWLRNNPIKGLMLAIIGGLILGWLLSFYPAVSILFGSLFAFVNIFVKAVLLPIEPITHLILRYASSLRKSADLEKRKDSVVNKLSKHNFLTNLTMPKRIIVVIEDVDRLTPKEVLEMLQVVKMIADFPRITYLIPHDSKYVSRALDSLIPNAEEIKYGEGFVQKTIFTSFHLPSANATLNSDMLFKKVEAQQKNNYTDELFDNKDFYWKSYQPAFAALLKTPRHVQKVYNRSLILFESLTDNCHPADVLVVAYLKEYQNNLWQIFLERQLNMVAPSISRIYDIQNELQPDETHAHYKEEFEKLIEANTGNDSQLINRLFKNFVFNQNLFQDEEHRLCVYLGILKYEYLTALRSDEIIHKAKDFYLFDNLTQSDLVKTLNSELQAEVNFFNALEKLAQERSIPFTAKVANKTKILSSLDHGSYFSKERAYIFLGWHLQKDWFQKKQQLKIFKKFFFEILGEDIGLAMIFVLRLATANEFVNMPHSQTPKSWEKIDTEFWVSLKKDVLARLIEYHAQPNSLYDFLKSPGCNHLLGMWYIIDVEHFKMFFLSIVERNDNHLAFKFLDLFMSRVAPNPTIVNKLGIRDDVLKFLIEAKDDPRISKDHPNAHDFIETLENRSGSVKKQTA